MEIAVDAIGYFQVPTRGLELACTRGSSWGINFSSEKTPFVLAFMWWSSLQCLW